MSHTGKTYNGTQFNEIYKDRTFCKILRDDLTHHNFTYKEGLNKDTQNFKPSGSCSVGGLYFSDTSVCYLYLDYGLKFSYVTIPDDAQVYVEDKKFKADKIILTKILQLTELNEFDDYKFSQMAVQTFGHSLQFVNNRKDTTSSKIDDVQMNEICKSAVQQDGYMLQYVKNQTDEICMIAVRQNGHALQFVKDQTDEICMMAIKCDGYPLQYVKDQTDNICKIAVKQNGLALRYVKNKTYELCEFAIKQNGYSIQFIEKSKFDNAQIKELCKLAIKQNVRASKHVKALKKSMK